MDVGRAAEEPQQLAHDRREQDLLGGDEREALAQVVAGLRAEQRDRPGAGAVGPALAVVEHVAQEIEVRTHSLPIAPPYDHDVDPRPATIRDLLDSYDGVLLDAYGVLVDARGPLPAAPPLIAELNRRSTPYAIVTNDASRSPATYVRRFAAMGLAIPEERIVTSGGLLARVLPRARARRCAHHGARHRGLVRLRARGRRRSRSSSSPAPRSTLSRSATTRARRSSTGSSSRSPRSCARSRPAAHPHWSCRTPTSSTRRAIGEFGFTAGAMALLIEAALATPVPRRVPGVRAPRQAGAPSVRARACAASARSKLVMIGDQLETDIAGARAAGVDSALLAGVSRWQAGSAIAPTYLLATIAP